MKSNLRPSTNNDQQSKKNCFSPSQDQGDKRRSKQFLAIKDLFEAFSQRELIYCLFAHSIEIIFHGAVRYISMSNIT